MKTILLILGIFCLIFQAYSQTAEAGADQIICTYQGIAPYEETPAEAYRPFLVEEGDGKSLDINPLNACATLEASPIEQGTGYWIVTEGSAQIINATQYNTRVYNLAYGKNTFRWTVTVGLQTDFDEVSIYNGLPSPADADGEWHDMVVCGNATYLEAQIPERATATWWEQVNIPETGNTVVIEQPTKATTRVTGLPVNIDPPSGSINEPSSFTAKGATTSFIWHSEYATHYSINSSGEISLSSLPNESLEKKCFLSDTVTITALIDGETPPWKYILCKDRHEQIFEFPIMDLLPRNNLIPDNIYVWWSIVSGSVSINNSGPSYMNFTNIAHGENKIRLSCWIPLYYWDNIPEMDKDKLHPNGENYLYECINSVEINEPKKYCVETLQITLINNKPYPIQAMEDVTVCGDNVVLQAEELKLGSGKWSREGDAQIENNTSNVTKVSGLKQGINTFVWKIESQGGWLGNCFEYDTVNVFFHNNAEITTQNQTVCENNILLSATEPQQGTGQWYNTSSNTTFANNTTVNLSVGENIFEWKVTNGECSDIALLSITYNPIVSEIQVEQADCKLNPAGRITVNATGGNGSLAYSKDNGLTFETNKNIFNDLTAGTYHIKIKDSENCETDLGTRTIEELILPEITDVEFIEFENGDGAKYKVNIDGGTEPFNIWLNGETSPNEIIEGVTAGNYTVKAQDHKGCEAVYSFNIVNTDITEEKLQSNIKLYPNPSNSEVTIEINNANNFETKIEIYDALGRLKISKTTKSKAIKIDTCELKTGIYFVKISNNATIKSRILMINRTE